MAGERRWSDRTARPSGCAVILIAALTVNRVWVNYVTHTLGWNWIWQ